MSAPVVTEGGKALGFVDVLDVVAFLVEQELALPIVSDTKTTQFPATHACDIIGACIQSFLKERLDTRTNDITCMGCRKLGCLRIRYDWESEFLFDKKGDNIQHINES